MPHEPPSTRTAGVAIAVAAYATWGVLPLYWRLLEPAGAVEILAHRVVWCLPLLLLLLAVRRRLRLLSVLLRQRRAVLLSALAAVLIAVNWLAFIYGVTSGRVVETSLGYFVIPLVSIVVGAVCFAERLGRLQWLSVLVGLAAVIVLGVGYGRPPVVALVIATSFVGYGVVKKVIRIDSMVGLALETALLAPPAAAYLVVLAVRGDGAGAAATGSPSLLLLATSGAATALPLLLFGAAASRVPLSVLGVLQYLAPSLQFVIGTAVLGEVMTTGVWSGFALVWVAVLLFVGSAVLDAVRARRPAGVAPTLTGTVA